MSRFCGKCGAEISDFNTYCLRCGHNRYEAEGLWKEPKSVEPIYYKPSNKRGIILAIVALVLIISPVCCMFAFTGHDSTLTIEYTNTGNKQMTLSVSMEGKHVDSITIQPGQTGRITGNCYMSFGQFSKNISVFIGKKVDDDPFGYLWNYKFVKVGSGKNVVYKSN